MEIISIKQVEKLAQGMFKCAVLPLHDVNVKGYMGVKLIVGQKANLAYDSAFHARYNVNPNDPQLLNEVGHNEDLLKNKINPLAPDIRILWVKPGTNEQDLVNNELMRIKKSLDAPKPNIVKDETIMTIAKGPSDAELAAKIASGEMIDSRVKDFYDDRDEENYEMVGGEENYEKSDDQETGKIDEVLESINVLAQSMGTLAEDIKNINDRVENIETTEKKKAIVEKRKATIEANKAKKESENNK